MNEYNTNTDFQHTEIGILTSPCDKYKPGFQTFYLPSLNPMNLKSNTKQTINVQPSNLVNKEPIKGGKIQVGSNIWVEMPKEVARQYPYKYIPPGTRFIIGFPSGDITKPIVIGRDYDAYRDK